MLTLSSFIIKVNTFNVSVTCSSVFDSFLFKYFPPLQLIHTKKCVGVCVCVCVCVGESERETEGGSIMSTQQERRIH